MSELRFLVPGPDEPGYLLREQKRLKFLGEYLEIESGEDKIPFLIDYLLQFVTEPKDREKAKELLWDASEAVITELRQYFVLGLSPDEESDDVPDPEKEGSGAG